MARVIISELPDSVPSEATVFELEKSGQSGKVSLAGLRTALFPAGMPDVTPINGAIDTLNADVAALYDVFGSAAAALTSAQQAEIARLAAVAARGLSEQFATDSETARNQSQDAQTAAESAQAAADAAAAASATSATSAAGSATSAAGSAVVAQNHADDAGTSATAASASALAASVSSADAATSASAASTSASAASASQTAAGSSASAANQSKLDAQTASTAAGNSASASAASATSAAASQTAAGSSASAADSSRIAAQAANTNAQSAATAASGSATAASGSAATASSQATLASTYASNASTSANAANTSATSASGSAATAASQASLASGYAGAAASSATAAATSSTAASASASAAQSSAVLSASIGLGALNKNSNFADWPGGSGTIPASWNNWNHGTTNTRVTGDLGGFAFDQDAAVAYNNYGIYCNPQGLIGLVPTGYFVIEAEVTLVSGQFGGSGVYIAKTGFSASINFSVDKDQTNAAPGAGVAGRRYKFAKLINATGSSTDWVQYLMTQWTGFNGSILARIKWHRCSVRPATPAEIRDQTVLAPMEATVSTHSSAISTLQGRTVAFMETTTVAGGAAAAFRMRAESSPGVFTSDIELVAKEIRLGESGATGVPALKIVGGKAEFAGELNVGGSSGARVNITQNLVRVYDASGTLRVRMGIW